MPESRVMFAHNLRTFAIVMVVISHFAGLFWTRPEVIHSLLLIPDAADTHKGAMLTIAKTISFHSWIDYGGIGVAVFFVISGFVIPFSLERLSRGQFAVARFFRIYPTYWAAMLFTLTAIYCCGRYFDVSATVEPGRIVKQMLLIRDWFWLPPVDAVSWSLEMEIKFYLLCLLLAGWLRSGRILPLLLTGAILAVVSLLAGDGDNSGIVKWSAVLQYDLPIILYMFTGVMLNLLYRKKIDLGTTVFGIVWFLGLALFTVRKSEILSSYFPQFALNYSLALALFCVCYYFQRFALKNRAVNFLADISYPLYAIHAVGGFVMMEILLARGFSSWLATLISFGGVIIVATLLHFLIENPTIKLGKFLLRRFPRT